jgi:polysaccharide export outer membrane protein
MRKLLIILFAITALTSCKLFKSNLMLRTPKNYNYDQLIDSLGKIDYKIAPNDAIFYKLFTNDGFNLINLASQTNVAKSDIDVIVESDGQIKMPLIGRIKVEGLTIIEAEKMLEDRYLEFYVKPFVTLRVNNKRVIVFPGNTGDAKVLTLSNNNTTVLEAIASSGGIPEDGKAYKAKLIRVNPDPTKKPFVYLMDLSRIEGLKLGNSKVQAGDIIYIEPRYRPLRTFSSEIAPLVSVITSLIILYSFSKIR